MKSVVSETVATPRAAPYIGMSDHGTVVLFTTPASSSMARGVVLHPGASPRATGDWVTYDMGDFPPLVGSITLEN